MKEHAEIYTLINNIITNHTIEVTIVIFVVSTLAGIVRFCEKNTSYALYHIMSSLMFFFTWMVLCAHFMLPSYHALLGVSIGSYMGPKIVNIAMHYVMEKIKAKLKH